MVSCELEPIPNRLKIKQAFQPCPNCTIEASLIGIIRPVVATCLHKLFSIIPLVHGSFKDQLWVVDFTIEVGDPSCRCSHLFFLATRMAAEQDTETLSGARGTIVSQRIDRPHAVQNGHYSNGLMPEAGCSNAIPEPLVDSTGPDSTGLDLLSCHAEDLVDRLQHWQAELDAREAQLNARDALFDLQVRQFRLWEQQQRAQAAETVRAATSSNEELKQALRRRIIAETPVASLSR
jgi:hypothetical protein